MVLFFSAVGPHGDGHGGGVATQLGIVVGAPAPFPADESGGAAFLHGAGVAAQPLGAAKRE